MYSSLPDIARYRYTSGFRIAAERDVNEGVDEEEGIVQMVQSSPRESTRSIARLLRVPQT